MLTEKISMASFQWTLHNFSRHFETESLLSPKWRGEWRQTPDRLFRSQCGKKRDSLTQDFRTIERKLHKELLTLTITIIKRCGNTEKLSLGLCCFIT